MQTNGHLSLLCRCYNVKEVALPGDHFFKEIKDHSKYAISGTSEGWVCVGGY